MFDTIQTFGRSQATFCLRIALSLSRVAVTSKSSAPAPPSHGKRSSTLPLMTRAEAEARRDQLAKEQPEVTWLVAGDDETGWRVVKVGIKPNDPAMVETSEERPRPPQPDDTRSGHIRRVGGNIA